MANPYPVTIRDESGVARLVGEADFSDPGNQPGPPTPDLQTVLGAGNDAGGVPITNTTGVAAGPLQPLAATAGSGAAGQDGSALTLAGGNGDAGATIGAEIICRGGVSGEDGAIVVRTDNTQVELHAGAADPSMAPGVAAGLLGSLYIRTTGELWIKSGGAGTDWTKIGP